MFSIRTILCPTDYTEPSEGAVRTAESLARVFGARLILLHVAELPPIYRKPLKEIAIDPAIDVTRRIVRGFAPDDIVRVARECQCDVIVIGTHGRSGLARLINGSVAEEVIRNAPCPVISLGPGAFSLATSDEQGLAAANQ